MSTTATSPAAADAVAGDAVSIKRRWWLEIVYVLIFYIIYSMIRNQFGSGGNFAVGNQRALDNAKLIIDIEKSIGLFIEEAVQEAVIGWDWFVQFWNVFYGSLHFVITGAAMIYLYAKFPNRYRRYRNVLAATTSFALIGFLTFPLMPPRLLNAGQPFGATLSDYTFVDTLADVGGLWSFDSGTMQSISNQWAAMPSLHIAWAMWCTVALFPVFRRTSAKIVLVLYPVLSLYAIVVTANHYWIDAVGGALILWAGWHVGTRSSTWIRPRLPAPDTEPKADRVTESEIDAAH